MNVYEKLRYVQQNLKAPKSQYNKFGDFHYRSCEDIQESVKPLLEETKTILLTKDEVVLIGNRYYIMATAIFRDTESDECITNSAFARETEEKPKMDPAQITGSCSSYARKYALNGLFCIDDSKDPDTPMPERSADRQQSTEKKTTGNQQRHQPNGKIGQQHIESIKTQMYKKGVNNASVCATYGIKQLGDMTITQYKDCMTRFQNMPDIIAPEPAPQDTYDQMQSYEQMGMFDGAPFR